MNYEVAKSRVPLALLSLFIALSLWVYVQAQNEPAAPNVSAYSFSLPVQPKKLPSNLSLVHPLGNVKVTVKVTPEEQKKIVQANYVAFVDLTDATEGEREYKVEIAGPLDLAARFRPDHLIVKVNLEAIISKTFEVHTDTRNSPMETGMLYTNSTCDPKEVKVTGPRSQVNMVARVRALIDLSKVSQGVLVTQPVDCVDDNNQLVSDVVADPKTVSVRPNLSPAPVAKTVLVNARFSGQPEFGYHVSSNGIRVEPSKIEVEGTSEAMSRLTGILDTLSIDISGIRATRTFSTSVSLPPGLRVRGSNSIRVTVKIEGPSVGGPPSGG